MLQSNTRCSKGDWGHRQDTKSDARKAKGERRVKNQAIHNTLGASDFPASALWSSSQRPLCSIPDISLPISLLHPFKHYVPFQE